jgi:hypothetical protein
MFTDVLKEKCCLHPQGRTPSSMWKKRYRYEERMAGLVHIERYFRKKDLRDLSPQSNYTEWPPDVGEVSANFLHIECATWSS